MSDDILKALAEAHRLAVLNGTTYCVVDSEGKLEVVPEEVVKRHNAPLLESISPPEDKNKFINIRDFINKLPPHVVLRLPDNVDKPNECWVFNGDPSSNGYMRCWIKNRRIPAHKAIWQIATGIKLRTRQLDHLCENRPCCNPNHMQPVTAKQNAIRRTRRRKRV